MQCVASIELNSCSWHRNLNVSQIQVVIISAINALSGGQVLLYLAGTVVGTEC